MPSNIPIQLQKINYHSIDHAMIQDRDILATLLHMQDEPLIIIIKKISNQLTFVQE